MNGETPGPNPEENLKEMGLRPEDVSVGKPFREDLPVAEKKEGKEIINPGKLETFSVKRVGEKEAEEVMNKVEIQADPFNGQRLTPEDLKEEGLAPHHKVAIDGKNILFSPAYDLGRGHIGVVAYTEKDEGFVARSYYRSSSHGLWRYLPDYIPAEDKIRLYGKGHSSESVTLPVVLQKALSGIVKEQGNLIEVDRPDFVFAGTAFKPGDKGDYYQEVEKAPKLLEGNFYPAQGQEILPEKLKFNSPENAPDFSKTLASWRQQSDLYGEMAVEVFPSRDGQFQFLFCQDSEGRAWIGGIEKESEIGLTGLWREWVDGGDLATPAFEYSEEAGVYGSVEGRRGHYVDMFPNYLSKVPIIQEYLLLHGKSV